MDPEEILKEYENEIIEISKKIYNFAELGSEEHKSSKLLNESLRKHGFKVEQPYMNMDTAFRADFGSERPRIGFLAEYDALPNGHSCGHNLIAAWAYGSAILLSKIIKNGSIAVFGTPAEEGRGRYAGSKAIMAENGAFKDVDFVIGMHPDDKWRVGGKALADVTIEIIVKGKASHMAADPDKGLNALDGAVLIYQGINNLRSRIKIDKNAVIGMIIKEGGTASNVVPERAVMEVDLRSSSGEYLKTLLENVKNLAKGICSGYGLKCEINTITPFYENYVSNKVIDKLLLEELNNLGIKAENYDNVVSSGFGSTDEANVSKVVPTGHIDIKVGYEGIPAHTEDFRKAVDPEVAKDSLMKGIIAAVKTAKNVLEDKELLKKIRKDFEKSLTYGRKTH